MKLSELKQNEKAIIVKVKGHGAFRKRIIEMGFVVGQEIFIVKKAPLKDPIEYNIMGYNISLRNSEAELIEVVSENEIQPIIQKNNNNYHEGINEKMLKLNAREKGKTINVAFVGNPNSGKTTLFNHASGSKEHVGNYGGVTVDAKEARFKLYDYTFNVVDLPGTYSITAYSPEELFVRDHIFNTMPDIVVNVIDSTNLERNLYLTTQLIDMNVKVVIALNMFDEFQKQGNKLDYQMLGDMLGIPMVPTVGLKGKGIKNLLQKIIEVHQDQDDTVRQININYGQTTEKSIEALTNLIDIPENKDLTTKISSRFLAVKLLEKDKETTKKISTLTNSKEILHTTESEAIKMESIFGDDSEAQITDARYGFIAGALKQTHKKSGGQQHKRTKIVDSFITHKFWGIPVFLFFMWLTFFTTFKLGAYPMSWIESLVEIISNSLYHVMPPGMFKDLLIQGIIGGVGGVIIFLPNILLLYFFIALMEDTGYMARAVFIMDKAMHKIGLHGKSFIPLLMGFGCNVPAIMSTRIIESKRDRLITILINPFMSCSARLPVYILFISAFFTAYQGTILFSLYGIGVLLAILSAILFRKTMFKTQDVPFVMELPPYRLPSGKTLIKHMWHRAVQYLKKIGGVILLASVIIWALGYFPRDPESEKIFSTKKENIAQFYDNKIQNTDQKQITDSLTHAKALALHKTDLQEQSQHQEQSYIGRIGKFIQPVMQPLGFDWKMSVGIVTGVAAKEVVVGTLGVLYQANPEDDSIEKESSLIQKLRNQTYNSGPHKGQKVFTPLIAFTFMLFVLIYFPCIAVIATIRKETGTWKWAIFTIFYTSGLAWIISFMVYQIGSLL
ncbi:MAG: ferrous iron transport protein B [Bacteroidota bacterium]